MYDLETLIKLIETGMQTTPPNYASFAQWDHRGKCYCTCAVGAALVAEDPVFFTTPLLAPQEVIDKYTGSRVSEFLREHSVDIEKLRPATLGDEELRYLLGRISLKYGDFPQLGDFIFLINDRYYGDMDRRQYVINVLRISIDNDAIFTAED